MSRLRRLPELSFMQKWTVFALSMILCGGSAMVASLLPQMNFGPLTFSAEYFVFIPLILCILFNPLYAALGAATGQLLVNGLIASQMSSIDGLEKFLALFLALLIAGSLVKNPENKKQIAVASLSFAVIYFGIGSIADIMQVIAGAADLEALPGLTEVIIAIEIFSFFNAVVVSGILLGMIPAAFLVPGLHQQLQFFHRRKIVLKARRIRSYG